MAVRSAQKLENNNGDHVCIEWPHSLAKPEGIVHTQVSFKSEIHDT